MPKKGARKILTPPALANPINPDIPPTKFDAEKEVVEKGGAHEGAIESAHEMSMRKRGPKGKGTGEATILYMNESCISNLSSPERG